MIKIVGGFFVLMVMIAAGTVYSLKETTERLDARKLQLSAKILKDRAAIKVLRAEMAFLSQPERLQKLSSRFLALHPAQSQQMAESVTALAGRQEGQLASLPVDTFPLLLPQEKPTFKKERFASAATLAAYSVEVESESKPEQAQPVAQVKRKEIDFFKRISLKLEEKE